MNEAQPPPDEDRPDFAYFFLPLSEPLRLPDGFVVETVIPVDFMQLRELHDDAHRYPEETLLCSVRLFHIPVAGVPLFVPPVNAAMAAAGRALPFAIGGSADESEEISDATDSFNLTWTVAEVAVPLADTIEDGEVDIISEAFDIGLEVVRNIQSAYSIATKEAVTLVTRENLPPFIPYALRWINTGVPAEDRWTDGMSLYTVNTNVLSHVRGDDMSSDELTTFDQALSATGREMRAFIGYADMRRDAHLALERRGDYRAAVAAAETAAEVLLDDLLLHMLWEERTAPETAAACFQDRRMKPRVRTHYHGRLGGNWSTAQGPIADWVRDLSAVRNRVVHAGYTPTRDQARDALAALDRLDSFVVERLIQPQAVRRYPRTVMGFLGKATLEAHGRWEKRLEDLVNDPQEPDWVRTFARWRWIVEDTLGEIAHVELEGSNHLVSVLRIDTDGTQEWWTHDVARRRVCRSSEPPDMTAEARASLQEAIAASQEAGIDGPLTMGWIGPAVPPPAEAKWFREHEILPFHEVMLPPGP